MGVTTKTHKFSGGRLVLNPTDLNSPETDCDGTQLGNVQNVRVRITRRQDPIIAQEFGMTTYDAVLLDSEVLLIARFVGWDEDAMSRVFYQGAVGAGVSTTPLMIDTESVYGELAGDTRASDLLWLPNDDVNSPAVRAYRAIPWRLPNVLQWSGRRPLIVEASWLCTRNSTGRVLRSDLLASGNL